MQAMKRYQPMTKDERPCLNVRRQHSMDGWYGCGSCGMEVQLEFSGDKRLVHGLTMFNCKVCASVSQSKSKKRSIHDDSANRVYCGFCFQWIRSDKWKKHEKTHFVAPGPSKTQKRSSLRVLAIRDPRTLAAPLLLSAVHEDSNCIQIGLLNKSESLTSSKLLIDIQNNDALIVNIKSWRGPLARVSLTLLFHDNKQTLEARSVYVNEKTGITITTNFLPSFTKKVIADLNIQLWSSQSSTALPLTYILPKSLFFIDAKPIRSLLARMTPVVPIDETQDKTKTTDLETSFLVLVEQSAAKHTSKAVWWSKHAKDLITIQTIAEDQHCYKLSSFIVEAQWSFVKKYLLQHTQIQAVLACGGIETKILHFLASSSHTEAANDDPSSSSDKDRLRILAAACTPTQTIQHPPVTVKKEYKRKKPNHANTNSQPLKKQAVKLLLPHCEAKGQNDCLCSVGGPVTSCALDQEAMVLSYSHLPTVRIVSQLGAVPLDFTLSAPVSCSAISAKHNVTATGTADGCIRIYANDTGILLLSLVASTTPVSLAFIPSGRILAAVCYDAHLRLWDLSTGTLFAHLAAGAVHYSHCAISSQLVCVADSTLRFWDLMTGRFTGVITPILPKKQPVHITKILFSHDGQLIATAISQDDVARIYNAYSGSLVYALQLSDTRNLSITAFAFDQHAQRLAIVASDSSISIFHLASRSLLLFIQHNAGQIAACTFTKNDTTIVVAAVQSATLALFDANTGARITLPALSNNSFARTSNQKHLPLPLVPYPQVSHPNFAMPIHMQPPPPPHMANIPPPIQDRNLSFNGII